MKNSIISRYYVVADISLATPLSLSGGIGGHTDSDVMRDGEGRLLLPGSSVAGAFRKYIGQKKEEKGVFGYSGREETTEQEEGFMSSLFFSDIYFEESIVAERDGVSLTEEKTVDNKFDYEVIETGAKARMRIEKIFREKDNDRGIQDNLSEIQEMLNALNQGEIRFGSRKNRGCGWIKVEKVYRYHFGIAGKNDGRAYTRWLNYCNSCEECTEDAVWENWEKKLEEEKFISLEVPLRLTGGISIRKYSTEPGKADFEHITVYGAGGEEIPVIPGTSWNGAIRSCAKNILQELRIPDIDKKLKQWFGMVDVSGNGAVKAQQSMVVIKESQLLGAVPMVSTRNKINRFDASTVDGALYTEKAYFGGRTVLHILVQKTDYAPLIGLLMLVIREIEEGYLAVGGQTAVGRGIFEADFGQNDKLWSEEIDEKRYLQELALLKEGY